VKLFTILLLSCITLFGATDLKIATYNVENLFDLQRSGHEYVEYIPNTNANWNKKTYKIKLQNTAKVIKEINADIIALQEIESPQALKDLRYTLKQNGLYYQYFKIADKKNTTIKVAILSKIPFLYTKELSVTSSYKYRNILEAKFRIDNQDLYLFVNHWKSKSGAESRRIVSAKVLRKRIKALGKDKNIILLGDFNSDYEEYKRFRRKRKLNDTNGRTGINDVLHTKYQTVKASKIKYNEKYLYNLWYDTNKDERYTYIFRGKKEAMDSIIVSQSLLQKNGIFYQLHSISAFKEKYLFKGKNIYRWKMSWKKPHKHKGKGYSDHLAVTARFVVE
jgi:endonuclease/exonuclease/phosphatase family metal-dependent hydrolase